MSKPFAQVKVIRIGPNRACEVVMYDRLSRRRKKRLAKTVEYLRARVQAGILNAFSRPEDSP